MFLSQWWAKIPPKWQIEITSITHTVITAMVVELGLQLSQGGSAIPTGKEALLALGAAVLRSGVKAFWTMVFVQIKPVETAP
jgi:hypothetical protein